MKKVFYLCSLLVLTVLASCGPANTPSAVAEASIKCIQNGDYAGYVDLIYSDSVGCVKLGRGMYIEKKEFVTMLEEKGSKEIDKEGGIKSYEVVSEEINEDGDSAVVKMSVTYGNGNVNDQTVSLRKDADDKWKINEQK